VEKIREIIRKALEENKLVIGFKEVYKNLKNGKLKTIIIAKRIDETMLKDLTHNAKIFGTEVIIFEGSSRELGTLIGKPYTVTTIGVRNDNKN